MAIKVLVVDDSSFFRRRVSEIINASPALEVIGTATNGLEAVQMVAKLKPDVVTMDIEMPVMDGIAAVKKIMAKSPLPILMFSSLTHAGAKATFDALDAGAADFLPKKFEDIARSKDEATKTLQQRIESISSRRFPPPKNDVEASTRSPSKINTIPSSNALRSMNLPERGKIEDLSRNRHQAINTNVAPSALTHAKNAVVANVPSRGTRSTFKSSGKQYDVLAIGTSTGGPVALQTVLTKLPRNFKLPILLIQHMPGTFTKAFAERLNSICQISVKEASDNDLLQAGYAYLAPGGKQMLLDGRPGNVRIKIHEGSEKLHYKPSVDLTFASLSKVYRNKVLAIILTGMGSDGKDGARMLKERGSVIWSQDKKSCVVYGMPMAIDKAGLSTQSISLDNIAQYIKIELKHE
ncbi:MAG: chemotaxis response regulator protein-glutamate methylesterase [Psychromonas sp.]|nr:chemotaxis response regulator protein-glutamate methylesterase [Psychromonas sp.]